MSAEELEQHLTKIDEKHKEIIKKASTIDEKKFELSMVLVTDLKTNSKVALANHLGINIRRISLLYMAMFVQNASWANLFAYMTLNLANLVYLLQVFPYT